MKKIYHDVTMVLSPHITLYEGDPEVRIQEFSSISKGDSCNISLITFGSHTGTHIDAPKHFLDDGMTVDKVPLDYFIGCAKVFSVNTGETVDVDSLEGFDINRGDRIILKTPNSDLINRPGFCKEYIYLTPDAAAFLAEKGIKTLGFDYLSVEKYGYESPDVHYTLLKNDIAIIEGLDLSRISPGEYEIVALPMKIKDGDGSPVRAVLIETVK